MIIESVRNIHKIYRLEKGDVSAHTKSAQKITREWQKAVCIGNIESEVRVSPENKEKIDIVDHNSNTAYELKVSGNNTHHEFYKDLIKVLTYNEHKPAGKKISTLVFISESSGIRSLERRLDSKFIKMLSSSHALSIELVRI